MTIAAAPPTDARAAHADALLEQVGRLWLELDSRASAVALVERAASEADPDARIVRTLGWLRVAQGRYAEGAAHLRRAFAMGWSDPDAIAALAEAEVHLGEVVSARRRIRELAERRPVRLVTLAVAADLWWRLGETAAYREALEGALACDPREALPENRLRAVAVRGRLRVREGDWRTGFAETTAMYGVPGWSHPGTYDVIRRVPWWDGEPLDGTLLVHAELGFGDALWMHRYLRVAAARARNVAVLVQPELERLFAGALPPNAGMAQPGGELHVAAHLPLMAFPALCGTLPETAPLPEPLGVASDARLPAGQGLRVGLAWSGDETHQHDVDRSCALADLEPLLEVPGVTFYAIQRNARLAEADRTAVLRLDHLVHDFADTAALVRQLDLVVTIDSAPAHLAGALGVPTLLLLPVGSEWRWGTDPERTPWYPSIRFIRQQRRGDWRAVALRAAQVIRSGEFRSLARAA